LFGEQQALSLPIFDWRNAELIVKDLAHVAIRHAQLLRQVRQRMFRQKILADTGKCGAGEFTAHLHRAGARCKFRATTFARPIPGHFRGGRVGIESAILSQRRFDPANRPAIDAR